MARPAEKKPRDWFVQKELEGDNAYQYRRNHPDYFTLSGLMRKDAPDGEKKNFEHCVWRDEQGLACPGKDELGEEKVTILGPRTEN